MSIWTIEQNLPNGFHDALLKKMDIHVVNREVIIHLDVWTGNLESKIEKERESYREARLVIHGFSYLTIDPPFKEEENFPPADNCRVDMGNWSALGPAYPIAPPVKDDGFNLYIFFCHWNNFIYLSARTADLYWLDELQR